MNIQEIALKIKGFVLGDWGIILVVILVGFASFGLGRLSALEEYKPQVEIRYENEASAASGISMEGKYIASKNGSVYHFPWCSGADRILEKNKVWFTTEQEAKLAGYKPAGNCKGL